MDAERIKSCQQVEPTKLVSLILRTKTEIKIIHVQYTKCTITSNDRKFNEVNVVS
jgi:hypothetical protein